jgi:hypothetical protein
MLVTLAWEMRRAWAMSTTRAYPLVLIRFENALEVIFGGAGEGAARAGVGKVWRAWPGGG